MTRILRYFVLLLLLAFTVDSVAQGANEIRATHKVKRKETIFGIARMYDLTIEDLIRVNPEMKEPGYELKKGYIINIPYTKPDSTMTAYSEKPAVIPATTQTPPVDDVRQREIRVGVMLPLHNINGDGKRMVEYYRGILMACDSLKQKGFSIDIHAWNAAEDADMTPILADPAAAKCDIIFGPLYSKQMQVLSDFVEKNDIRLVIPFSITAPQLLTNRNIFQIWQSPTNINEATIVHYLEKFKDYHPVFIDCNDSTSKKGIFTFGLRRQLEGRGIEYGITNLKSSEEVFSRSFSRTQKNMVILNTGRSPELGVAFAKINGLKFNNPSL